MSMLYILYRNEGGYSLFHVKEFDIGILPEIKASWRDLARFRNLVAPKLIGFSALKRGEFNTHHSNVDEGILPEPILMLLDSCLPRSTERDEVTLGLENSNYDFITFERKLGAAITKALNIKCEYENAIPTILKGIEYHYPSLSRVIYFSEYSNRATTFQTQLF